MEEAFPYRGHTVGRYSMGTLSFFRVFMFVFMANLATADLTTDHNVRGTKAEPKISPTAISATNGPVCSARKGNGTGEFLAYLFGRCFEYLPKAMTWKTCADYCKSVGGALVKLDESTLTDDFAEEFVKAIGAQNITGMHVGFTITAFGGKWIDGTNVTVPDVVMMALGTCGRLFVLSDGGNAGFLLAGFPCGSKSRCICEYDVPDDTTSTVPADTTTQVAVDTTQVHEDTTTAARFGTTTEVVNDVTTNVPAITTGDVHVDKTTRTTRTRPQTTSTTEELTTHRTAENPVDVTTRAVDTDTGAKAELGERSLTQVFAMLERLRRSAIKTLSEPLWAVPGTSLVSCGGMCLTRRGGCDVVRFDKRTRQCVGYIEGGGPRKEAGPVNHRSTFWKVYSFP